MRKASRFARHTSLIRVELDGAGALLERLGPGEYRGWAQEVASCIRQALRSTDLLAVEGDARFCIHLPEADALGATVAKRRVRAAVERSAPMRVLDAAERPTVLCGSATYPGDGSGLDILPLLGRNGKPAPPVILYSATEPSRELTHRVQGALVKSRDSVEQLLATVRSLAGKRG